MEEAHTFLSRPPNFVSLQKLQEERLKEKREKEEEEERQQRLAEEEEERKKIDEQQEQEREERIHKSNGMKKSHKQLKIRDESSSKSQDQEDVNESINGSEKSKQKKKKKWTKSKIERKSVKAAKDEIQNAAEKESGDDHKEKLEANWVWRKKAVHEVEMVKRVGAITLVNGCDEIKKRNGKVDVSPNLVTEADMVKKIEAITVTSGDDGLVKEEKKRHEGTMVNRGSGGSRYGRKMVGTSSRIDENLIWVKKEQATGQKTGVRFK